MKLFIAIFIMVLILFVGFLIITFRTSNKVTPQASTIPTASVPVFSPNPGSSVVASSSANTGYSPEGLNQNFTRTTSATLSHQDQAVFSKLTANLDGKSDVITTSGSFVIKYVNPPNEFLIQITSNNADQGKLDAISWLKQQGFSDQGICNLKAVIYLGPEVRNYYQQNNLQFNPVPQGC